MPIPSTLDTAINTAVKNYLADQTEASVTALKLAIKNSFMAILSDAKKRNEAIAFAKSISGLNDEILTKIANGASEYQGFDIDELNSPEPEKTLPSSLSSYLASDEEARHTYLSIAAFVEADIALAASIHNPIPEMTDMIEEGPFVWLTSKSYNQFVLPSLTELSEEEFKTALLTPPAPELPDLSLSSHASSPQSTAPESRRKQPVVVQPVLSPSSVLRKDEQESTDSLTSSVSQPPVIHPMTPPTPSPQVSRRVRTAPVHKIPHQPWWLRILNVILAIGEAIGTNAGYLAGALSGALFVGPNFGGSTLSATKFREDDNQYTSEPVISRHQPLLSSTSTVTLFLGSRSAPSFTTPALAKTKTPERIPVMPLVTPQPLHEEVSNPRLSR